MKKTLLILIALLCISAQGTWAQTPVSYIYRSWNGTDVTTEVRNVDVYTELKGTVGGNVTLTNNNWYVVRDNNVTAGKLIVPDNSTVHLILCDGAQLTSVVNYQLNSSYKGTLYIYGQEENTGKLIADASGTRGCAGIGGTTENIGSTSERNHPGYLIVHGGSITAKGGKYAAGIGGCEDGEGATVTIYGGNVSAFGGTDAAGIGCGEDGKISGSLTVYGGTVFADGTGWGAGIGAGEDSDGANVKIYGGSVTAWAGADAGNKNGSAIGSEDGDGHFGDLTIGPRMMVKAGNSPSTVSLFKTGERISACRWRPYCVVGPCTHDGSSYVINSTGAAGTHTLKCPHCEGITNETHDFAGGSECIKCHLQTVVYTVRFRFPNKATGYYDEYVPTRNVVQGGTVVLPTSPSEYLPDGATFAGWRVGEPGASESCFITESEPDLLAAGTSYTVNSDITLTARYRSTEINIVNDADNFNVIYENHGKKVGRVTLKGRTLYKDGKWNTICLPFDLTIANSELDGAGVDVRTLESTTWENGKLTLNFTEKVTEIKAGKPYLIKWDSGIDLTEYNLVFYGKTIKYGMQPVETNHVAFIGTFSPVAIGMSGDNQLNLYLDSKQNDKLCYPESDNFKLNSCRAYFSLQNGLYANSTGIHNILEPGVNAREIILNFGEGSATGMSLTPVPSPKGEGSVYYSLDGRRLQGKPTTKGVYINNGKKVIIK